MYKLNSENAVLDKSDVSNATSKNRERFGKKCTCVVRIAVGLYPPWYIFAV